MLNHNFVKLIFLSLGVVSVGCSDVKHSDSSPNILWITAEDISAVFGCYGDDYANTPNIDKLATQGIVFSNVYASAPICAPARSSLITGRHATSMGTQHLRSEISVPEFLKILPEYLRNSGYYCTNNSKTDYNFDPSGRWDMNGSDAHWRNVQGKTPFFSIYNYGITHEGNTNKFISQEFNGEIKNHNPDSAVLPPFFPNTDEFRTIWAHAYDLISKFDVKVGEHVEELREAGKFENTIIFIFSDHGFGLPRYKRWNYKTGLHVPLVVYVPEKYKDWFNADIGETDNRLISFVDFAPTVMKLAGMDADPEMQGISFVGNNEENEFVYAARSRADDVYDISRLVTDGRFEYIRNFMPYKAYIQNALIFGDGKRSFLELQRLKEKGELNDTILRMYQSKATEELYDLENDPYELDNLAGDSVYNKILVALRLQLKTSLIEKKDIGFLHESEMMIRAEKTSPLEVASDSACYNLEQIIEAAFTSSEENQDSDVIMGLLNNADSGVRFWGLNGVLNMNSPDEYIIDAVADLTTDTSPAVAILASEIIITHGIMKEKGLSVLMKYLRDSRPWVVLNAAMSLRRIDVEATPVLSEIKEEVTQYYGDVGAGYSSWMYPMFIGFALDQVIINCD